MKISVTHDKKLTFNFRKITLFFICIYVLTIYLGYVNGIFASIGSLCLMGMAAFAAITVIVEKKMQINPYVIWYMVFFLMAVISALYSGNSEASSGTLYSLVVILAIAFSFAVAVKEKKEVEYVFICLVIGSVLLMLYLIATGYIAEYEASDEAGKRFGNDLTENANSFASIYMIAACSAIYFSFAKKSLWIKLVCIGALLLQLYGLVLSGGRKFILIPFIMIYFIILFKGDKRGKRHPIITTGIAVVVFIIAYNLLMNVPFLYDNIGYRFESVVEYETGTAASADASAMEREAMREKAMILWTNHPLFGYGLNMFSKVAKWGVYCHNNFLELMCNNGIVGTFIYYSFYGYVVLLLLRNKEDSSVLKYFFIAFVLCELIYEYGGVTYNSVINQMFLMLAGTYIQMSKTNKEGLNNEQNKNVTTIIEK